MVDDDLAWDDEHPTLQQIPKPTGWETLIEERPLDEDLIATVKARRIDVRYELAQTKQRLKVMSLVAAAALGICLALGLTLWSRLSPPVAQAPNEVEHGDASPEVAQPEAAVPAKADVPAQVDVPAKADAAKDVPPAADPEASEQDTAPIAADEPEKAPAFGISAAGSGITMFVDGLEKGSLPLTVSDVPPGVHDVRFEDPAGRKRVIQIEIGADEHRDLGTITFDETKVQVVISLSTPRTVVLLKPENGKQKQLTGPWPMSLELDPGTYSLVAARRGRQTYARPLVLDLERPYREINIQLR